MDDKRFDDRESIKEINEYLDYLDKMKATVDKMLKKSIKEKEKTNEKK